MILEILEKNKESMLHVYVIFLEEKFLGLQKCYEIKSQVNTFYLYEIASILKF